MKKKIISLWNNLGAVFVVGANHQVVFHHSHMNSFIQIPSRQAYVQFIRVITAKLMKFFLKKWKLKLKNIYDGRPFTRLVSWGRSVTILLNYFRKNEIESGVLQVIEMPKKRKKY